MNCNITTAFIDIISKISLQFCCKLTKKRQVCKRTLNYNSSFKPFRVDTS